ncbi:MAG TPA: DUF4331 domain-containing protein, partial [Acidimicrobiales bacterium]|nr:DUF4331 domain-containing protein [Acidimicrobiales bacterium]
MSSHREAPEISKDPVADSTDLYAWVDSASTVTIIANYVPLEAPAGGPNFYEFGDDVVYEINIDQTGSGYPSITYRFRFTTTIVNPKTFLYNTGPIMSLTDPNWNRRQTYTVSRVDSGGHEQVLGTGACPPCNVGGRSTPNYAALAQSAVTTLASGEKVFAGQRSDAFWVDLGAVFDLAALRPFENLHLIPMPAAPGVNSLAASNVHSIAIQVPIARLTATGQVVGDPKSRNAVIGIWTSAHRQKVRMESEEGESVGVGPWHQVSRLGNPLFNEVIVPMAKKDRWNRLFPHYDANFAQYVAHPELAGLLPVLFPKVFPNLAAYTKPRADLLAILLTGIPTGVVPGFQNFTGTTQADMLRLNVAIPPSASPNSLGLIGGDPAGFPNGRRP